MNSSRRNFIKNTGLVSATLSITPALVHGMDDYRESVSAIIKKLTKVNDAGIDELLAIQIDEPGNRWHGGLVNAYDIPNAHSISGFITKLGTAYAAPGSDYYLSEQLEKALLLAVECLLRVQYKDGTIDLYSTNFHSTPDTAFIVNYISPVYIILKRLNRNGISPFLIKLEEFLINTGKCLSKGGMHTPNHRWVIASALARLNSFFPSKKYTRRIEEWLREGIDIDPDGQYYEQSVAIYSTVCNDMFLTMGRLLERSDLMDVVRKNLDMTLYYIQPGGEVLTDASGRQDNARTGYVNGYYYTYLYFSILDQNPQYAAVCELIENKMPEQIVRYLPYLMELDIFKKTPPVATKIPDNYRKQFKYSGVSRIRRANTDISIIENNPTFFSYMKGSAVLQSIRLAAAFFGSRGQFIAEEAEFDKEKIVLSREHRHGYFQPYPKNKIPGGWDYDLLPRSERKLSEPQTIKYNVTIKENEGKVSLEIEITGTENVPVSMELSFRPGGILSGVVKDENAENSWFLKEGTGVYKNGEDKIYFGPGKAEHKWAQMRGMLPKQNGNSVYLTGYTPFTHTLEIG